MYILELRRRWSFETQVCSAKSGLLSSYDGHLGKLSYAWQENRTLLEVSREAKRPLLFGRVILVFLSIFTKSQASSSFEARNSVHLSTCQRMRGPLSRRGGVLWLSLESPQGIRSSLHLVRWNMSLHLSHCREIRPSFESRRLGVHST